MPIRLAVVFVASFLGLGACTTVGNSPATAPPVTAAETTTTTMQTTTTLPEATTTTISRIAEIQAIFQDLEVRRLQAIMDQDEEAFRLVHANEDYEERSLVALRKVTVIDSSMVTFIVAAVYADERDCIAVGGSVDMTTAIEGGGMSLESDYVIERTADGWGYSWTGSGWRCDGPHPFSG